MTPYRNLMEDGELPADFLAQYPVAQPEDASAKISSVPPRQQQQPHEESWWQRRVEGNVNNSQSDKAEWYVDDRVEWRRGLFAVAFILLSCFMCGLWSMYT